MDDELEMLSDACRQFYERECAPHSDEWEAQGSFSRALWEKAGEMGLLGAEVPEESGGLGGSFAHDAVIAYQGNLAGIDGWGGGLHNSIVIPYLIHYGSDEQRHSILPRMISGDPAQGRICKISKPRLSKTAITTRFPAQRPSSPMVLWRI